MRPFPLGEDLELLRESVLAFADAAGRGLARRARYAAVACVATTALLWAGAVAALATTVSIGDRNFEAIAPEGHIVTLVYHPELRPLFESRLPPGARLVELYVATPDFNVLHSGGTPKLDSVYQLQVLKATEDKLLSDAGFAEVADAMEKGLAKTPAGVTFVGKNSREPWGLFYGLRLSDATSGSTEVGAALVVVNYQLMQLMYYVDAERRNARTEADQGVLAWAQALRGANPDMPYLAERAGKIDLGGKTASVESAAFGLGRLVGIALFIYLMYRLFVRRPN